MYEERDILAELRKSGGASLVVRRVRREARLHRCLRAAHGRIRRSTSKPRWRNPSEC